jgi:hypothetical protein
MAGEMSVDEISGGPRRRPLPSWAFWLCVGVVVAALAAAVLVQRRHTHPPATAASPVPGRVAVDTVCPVTAHTDGRRSLTVSFTLGNHGAEAVTVVRVEPVLVLGGLRPVSTATAAGTCERQAPAPEDGTLAPGGSLLVTFQFDVPPGTCPAPLPVQASVRVRAHGTTTVSQLAVLPDLGGVAFDACPSGG